LERSFAPHKTRFARKGLNLQGFATLRVGKKNVLVLDLEVRTNLFEKIPTLFGIFFGSDNFGLFAYFYEPSGKFESTIFFTQKCSICLSKLVFD